LVKNLTLIQPKIGTEMRRPLFPSRRYSHLESSTDCLRPEVIVGAMVGMVWVAVMVGAWWS
jgi:hypothetical protein